MSLIGIIFLLTFLFLLTKAILETLWGGWVLIKMAFWTIAAVLLDIAAFLVRMVTHPKKTRPETAPLAYMGQIICRTV